MTYHIEGIMPTDTKRTRKPDPTANRWTYRAALSWKWIKQHRSDVANEINRLTEERYPGKRLGVRDWDLPDTLKELK